MMNGFDNDVKRIDYVLGKVDEYPADQLPSLHASATLEVALQIAKLRVQLAEVVNLTWGDKRRIDSISIPTDERFTRVSDKPAKTINSEGEKL